MTAGLGILHVWFLLLATSGIVAVYTFNRLSGLDGLVYVATLVFIPIGLFCWWVCYLLSLEFLSEIGIELQGIARLLVLPVAIPMVGLSFILSVWVSAGEAIKNKTVLLLSFVFGICILLSVSVVFL